MKFMEKLEIKKIYLEQGITNSLQAELHGIKLQNLYTFENKSSHAKKNFVKQFVQFIGATEQ